MAKKKTKSMAEVPMEYRPTIHMNLPTKGVKVDGVDQLAMDKNVSVLIRGKVTSLRQEDYGDGKEYGVGIELASAEFSTESGKVSLKDAIATAEVKV